MHAPIRRALAFAVDWVVANVLAAILLLPVMYLSADPFRTGIVATPVLVAFCLIGLAASNRGNSPGKRWLKLQVAGTGCILCRELRRLGWVLLFAIQTLSDSLLPATTPILWTAIGLWLLTGFALPLLRRANDFPHNTGTGFRVESRITP